jgi:hypothetical protein
MVKSKQTSQKVMWIVCKAIKFLTSKTKDKMRSTLISALIIITPLSALAADPQFDVFNPPCLSANIYPKLSQANKVKCNSVAQQFSEPNVDANNFLNAKSQCARLGGLWHYTGAPDEYNKVRCSNS